MFKNILLAVDGSEHSLHAARISGDLARSLQAEDLYVVAAYEAIPPYIGDPYLQITIDARLKEAQTILKKAVDAVGEIPGELHSELIEGSAAESIIEVARTRKNDVIVMGARGLGRIAAAVLGSTSQKVVSHAPCPVLIVR
jgi:nucleotide-binding universal stress UspA family protein